MSSETTEASEVAALVKLAQPPEPLDSLHALTKLNLPKCGLSSLPSSLPTHLPNLSILFLPLNNFSQVPPVIGACPNLQMVSFKSNKLTSIHPDALQKQLRWLILTDNQLMELPAEIGRCTILQKLMLSGNQLTSIPEEISQCTKLELVRLASNKLSEPPMALLKLPNLAWIALSDNPFLEDMTALHESEEQSLPILDAPELESLDGPVLGAGASGTTRRLDYMGTPVAVKTYANDTMTSDGNPQQERLLALTASTVHADGLIQVLGVTLNKHCLVMELLEHYQALAGPPNMESCSRDVYADDCRLSTASARFLVSSMLQVLTELHNRGMSHGDFYGHNILVTNKGSFHAKLHDFGAAFYYDRSAGYAPYIERIELRAFGILVEEVQRRVCDEKDTMILQQFLELAKQSRSVPTFAALREWWTRMTERLIEHVEEHEFHQIGSEGA